MIILSNGCTVTTMTPFFLVNMSDIIETLFPKAAYNVFVPSENAVATTKTIKALQLAKDW
jgi:hypothetical protein